MLAMHATTTAAAGERRARGRAGRVRAARAPADPHRRRRAGVRHGVAGLDDLSNALRSGARVGSNPGRERKADYDILKSIEAAMKESPTARVQRIVIYKASTTNSAPSAACMAGTAVTNRATCTRAPTWPVRSPTSGAPPPAAARPRTGTGVPTTVRTSRPWGPTTSGSGCRSATTTSPTSSPAAASRSGTAPSCASNRG